MGSMVRSHHNQVCTLAFSHLQDVFWRCTDFDDEFCFPGNAGLERNELLKPFHRTVPFCLGVFQRNIGGHLENMQQSQVGVLVLRQPERIRKRFCRTRQQVGRAQNSRQLQFRYRFRGGVWPNREHGAGRGISNLFCYRAKKKLLYPASSMRPQYNQINFEFLHQFGQNLGDFSLSLFDEFLMPDSLEQLGRHKVCHLVLGRMSKVERVRRLRVVAYLRRDNAHDIQ